MKRILFFFLFWRSRPKLTLGLPISAKCAWKMAKIAAEQ